MKTYRDYLDNVPNLKSIGIAIYAANNNLDYSDLHLQTCNGKSGDKKVELWMVDAQRVLNTNADPIWENENHQIFSEALAWAFDIRMVKENEWVLEFGGYYPKKIWQATKDIPLIEDDKQASIYEGEDFLDNRGVRCYDFFETQEEAEASGKNR